MEDGETEAQAEVGPLKGEVLSLLARVLIWDHT